MQAEDVPQHCIEALAELLLDLAEHKQPDGCTRCSSDDVTHTHNGQPYCELCRGCYPDTAE
jgi:hypothetical protein